MPKAIDRRSARTQAALRGALITLLRRKEYGDITVQEILNEADVGRSTFYAHCSGKDQLVRLGFRLLRSELETGLSLDDGTRLLGFSLPIIEHLAAHRDLYRAFSGRRASELLFGELRQLVLDLAKRDMPGNDGVASEVALQFVVGAFTGLLAWWLKSGARLAPDAMDAMFQQLVRNGIAGHS